MKPRMNGLLSCLQVSTRRPFVRTETSHSSYSGHDLMACVGHFDPLRHRGMPILQLVLSPNADVVSQIDHIWR